MLELTRFFAELSPGKRAGLLASTMLVLAGAIGLGWWLLRPTYGVLFSDLSEADVSVVVRELDKIKVPYEIGSGGHSVLVPEASVLKTRIGLMGHEMPLVGAVGFELFNNSDFGASDFVQKVNYQRALQGELTRTILSIEQVRSARVHLALPEQGLFRKDAQRAKASVTIVMKEGEALRPPQVLGIQRLVAASVPEVQAGDVAVLDQHGVTLSRGAVDDQGLDAGRMDATDETEKHLAHKAAQVLDRMFGPGGALVTVSATLERQHVNVTTEEVLPAGGRSKELEPAGVLVREHTITHDIASADPAKDGAAGTTTEDSDYATGRRVEQVVSPAGAVTRLNVAVVVRQPLDDQQSARVRSMVSAAVGLQPQRGDVFALYAMPAAVAEPRPPEPVPLSAPAPAVPAVPANRVVPAILGGALAVALAALAVAGWIRLRSMRRSAEPVAHEPPPLSDGQRDAVLRSVQSWLTAREEAHHEV